MSQIKTKFIADNQVTNPKLAQMGGNTIKGNNTGSTANAADLTVAQVNTMLGDVLANGTVAFTADQSMGSHKLTNVTDPVSAQDAATKNYVDAGLAALNPADACYAASTATVAGSYSNGVAGIGATFTTTATTTFTIDGTTPPLNSRILFKDQTSGLQNGVYLFTALPVNGVSGAVFTRALDYDTPSDVNQAGLIPIVNGTTNALSSWQQVATITTIGTDALVFSEFTANPSLYLLKANNLSDVASAQTAINNLTNPQSSGKYLRSNGTNAALSSLVQADLPTIALTGDVTGSAAAGSIATTIAANAVTNSKLAQMAANTVKGNLTVSTANATDVSAVSTNTPTSVVTRDGSGNFAAGTITAALTGAASGNLAKSTGDIDQTSFTPANNQSSAANVTGLAFANANVRSAWVHYSITISATASLYETGVLKLIQRGSDWQMSQEFSGDDSLVVLTVTTAGQVQYTSPSYAGFSSAKMQFRAITTST